MTITVPLLITGELLMLSPKMVPHERAVLESAAVILSGAADRSAMG